MGMIEEMAKRKPRGKTKAVSKIKIYGKSGGYWKTLWFKTKPEEEAFVRHTKKLGLGYRLTKLRKVV